MDVELKQVLAGHGFWAGEVEHEGAGVEQSRGGRRLVRAVQLAEGGIAGLGECRGGTEPFIDLMRVSALQRAQMTLFSRTCLHAGPEMRMTAIAAFPDAVDRA